MKFFHFYFLAKDLLLNNVYWISIFFQRCQRYSSGGNSVSGFLFRPWFLFYLKKRENFSVFFKHFFLDFIKQKLGHLKNIFNSMSVKFQWLKQIIK